jgi:hypothetical protein
MRIQRHEIRHARSIIVQSQLVKKPGGYHVLMPTYRIPDLELDLFTRNGDEASSEFHTKS